MLENSSDCCMEIPDNFGDRLAVERAFTDQDYHRLSATANIPTMKRASLVRAVSPGVRRSCTCFRFPYAPLRPLFDAARYVHCATPDVLPLTYSTPRGPPRASLMRVPLSLLLSGISSRSCISIHRRYTSRRTHHRITVGASGGTAKPKPARL